MKFLAIEVENTGLKNEDFLPHLRNESLKVLELYEKGIIREIYFNENHCAVIILECQDKAYAVKILNELPLVSNKLITFKLIELNPYTGFSRLTS